MLETLRVNTASYQFHRSTVVRFSVDSTSVGEVVNQETSGDPILPDLGSVFAIS
jgi:hypothetical protein